MPYNNNTCDDGIHISCRIPAARIDDIHLSCLYRVAPPCRQALQLQLHDEARTPSLSTMLVCVAKPLFCTSGISATPDMFDGCMPNFYRLNIQHTWQGMPARI